MRKCFMLMFCVISIFTSGCMRKPYDVPEFVEIGNSETAVLVPLSGNTENQASFQSEEFLKKNMVARKRIQIPHEWVQTGRWANDGKWVSSMALILVDRAPETRKWTPNENTGTSSSDEGLWAESSDSVGFSTGFECTARIPDNDSAIRFLYNYPSTSKNQEGHSDTGLDVIMDKEVRTEIQARFAEFANFYKMDDLRGEKSAMLEYIKYGTLPSNVEKPEGWRERVGVIEFFKERGIEITTIAQFGGFTYENPEIQKAIDKVFQAQQEEEVAKAETIAQKERNEAVKLAAEGKAEAAKLEADGKAEAAKLAAKGEAEAIQTVADAKAYEIEKAQQNWEQYYLLKQMELESQKLEMWDGKYPLYMFGSLDELGGNVMISTPSVPNVNE